MELIRRCYNLSMAKQSAGILLYRRKDNQVEVLLVHPGGPFWAKKDLKAWGLPKGEFSEGEDPQAAAKREFKEELGLDPPTSSYVDLGTIKIPSKLIYGWAVESDLDTTRVNSNVISIVWPPRSGQTLQIPEVDKAEWFEISRAGPKMHGGQAVFLERLAEHLDIKLLKPEQPSLF